MALVQVGRLPGYQAKTGTIIVTPPPQTAPVGTDEKVAIYAYVSAT